MRHSPGRFLAISALAGALVGRVGLPEGENPLEDQALDHLENAAMTAVRLSQLGPRMRGALELVAEGRLTYREISKRTGLNPGDIHRGATSYGLRAVHLARRVQRDPRARRSAKLAAARLRARAADRTALLQLMRGDPRPDGTSF